MTHYCPGALFFFLSEGKKDWLALSTGILKNVLCISITVKNILLMRMDVNNYEGWDNRVWRIKNVVYCLQVLNTALHPQPLWFLTSKIEALQGLVLIQQIMRPCAFNLQLWVLFLEGISSLIRYWLILGKSFDRCIQIFIRCTVNFTNIRQRFFL